MPGKAADAGTEISGCGTLRCERRRYVIQPVRPYIPVNLALDPGPHGVQTVSETTNPRYHGLLKHFEQRTGCPVIVNTSFNVRGEPIVCTPEDAYRCFMRTEMDYLVLENFLLTKGKQPAWKKDDSWKDEFELD